MVFHFAGDIFPEWYWGPIFFTTATFPLFLGVAVVVAALAWIVLKRKKRLNAQRKILLLSSLVWAPIILSLVSYLPARFYLDHRTGSLNPYTQECIDGGFTGARGDVCF